MKNKNSAADQTLHKNLKGFLKKNNVQFLKLFQHMGITCLKQVCSLYGYFNLQLYIY